MKKIVGACVCALTLMGLVGQAEAAPISDWTLTVSSITLSGDSADSNTAASWLTPGYLSGFTTTAAEDITPGNFDTNSSTIDFGQIGIITTEALNGTGEGNWDTDLLFTLDFTFTVASESSSIAFTNMTYSFEFSSSYENGQETISITPAGYTNGSGSYKLGDYTYSLQDMTITNDSLAFIAPDLTLNSDTATGMFTVFDFNATVGVNAVYYDGPTATPEPATMLLMGLGLAGLGVVARRRNRK